MPHYFIVVFFLHYFAHVLSSIFPTVDAIAFSFIQSDPSSQSLRQVWKVVAYTRTSAIQSWEQVNIWSADIEVNNIGRKETFQ